MKETKTQQPFTVSGLAKRAELTETTARNWADKLGLGQRDQTGRRLFTETDVRTLQGARARLKTTVGA